MRKQASKVDVKKRLQAALRKLRECDRVLFDYDVAERAITHRLAVHLAREFRGYDVDCEYNRRGEAQKTVNGLLRRKAVAPKELGDDARVFPDIIVHRRGHDSHNLLVIEVKKDTAANDRGWDHEKLNGYKTELNYAHAVALTLHMDTGRGTVKWT